jgi:thiamine kinase-like enzyme
MTADDNRFVSAIPPNPAGWQAAIVDEEVLRGGVGNAGAVVRVGNEVLRPANPNTPAIHALLEHARARGFHGVPQPIEVASDGRERLVFIPGDVPYPPFPDWSQSERALTSAVELLRRYHDAVADFVAPTDARWNDELADPAGGTLICHNDVCPENVVYRDGIAVALLDFDFAAPGRALYDLAQLARMCVPLDTADDAAREGRRSLNSLAPFVRLRAVADAYGLPSDRTAFVDVITETMMGGSTFVRRRVERGEPAFIEMWNAMGGQARYDRRREWFERNRQQVLDALG